MGLSVINVPYTAAAKLAEKIDVFVCRCPKESGTVVRPRSTVAFVFVFEYIEYGNVLGADYVSDDPYHDDGSPQRAAQRFCVRECR
jgi:hypothetical protein